MMVLRQILVIFLMLLPFAATANPSQSPELYKAKQLVQAKPQEARQALEWIAQRGKPDMAAHLITALRYSPVLGQEIMLVLNKITGHSASNWFDWMLWQEKNVQIKPHASITHFKSGLFYSIDPAFKRFYRPEMSFDIRPEEVVWGGVHVDGIPALDNPKHLTAKEASYLRDDDEVFGVSINGDSRAYPLRIMGWHEMFNDVVGGVPVSLAYCTLCNAGILFEGSYQGREKWNVKEPFTFGSSGFLYRSNKLMYDRQTDSLWNQFTGEPVSGKLRGSGIKLKIRPVVITSWGEWKKQNPNTKVLGLDTGYRRDYGSGVVYQDYFASSKLMFPALGDRSRKLQEKDQIFGLRLTGGNKAWPLSKFKQGAVFNDTVGLVNVVLMGDAKSRTVRAYERKKLKFDSSLTTDDGRQWKLTEEALVDSKGNRLKRLPGHISYWFAWAGYLESE